MLAGGEQGRSGPVPAPVRDFAAQRRGIAALKAQRSPLDEQPALLESIPGPLARWSKTWAELERRLLNAGPAPEADG